MNVHDQPKPWLVAPHYVYELYTEASCFYVGVTLNLPRRLREHVANWYWPQIVRVEIARYPTQASGHEAERRRILQLNPAFNIMHASHPVGYARWELREALDFPLTVSRESADSGDAVGLPSGGADCLPP